jgi:hypothetical protein
MRVPVPDCADEEQEHAGEEQADPQDKFRHDSASCCIGYARQKSASANETIKDYAWPEPLVDSDACSRQDSRRESGSLSDDQLSLSCCLAESSGLGCLKVSHVGCCPVHANLLGQLERHL